MQLPKLATAPNFSPESRVWVYIAERPLTDAEATAAQQHLNNFVRQWTAHNQALQAEAEVYQNRFLLLMVDETQAGASGCSIDKSVHFLEQLGEHLGVDFFNRLLFGWAQGDAVHVEGKATFAQKVKNAEIGPDTLVVNTLVQTKKDLAEKWLLPIQESWHQRLLRST